MIFICNLNFWVVESRRGSNGPVGLYIILSKDTRLLCMLPGPNDPSVAYKECKQSLAIAPLVGPMESYTHKERRFFACYRVQKTHVCRIKG